MVLQQSNPSGYTVLGYAYLNLKKLDSAIICFSKVIELVPKYIDGYYGLAYTSFRMERYEQALKEIDNGVSKATKMIPFENKKLEILKGKVYYLSGSITKAKEFLFKHKGRLLDDGEASYFISIIYQNEGNSSKASQFKAKADKFGYKQTE